MPINDSTKILSAALYRYGLPLAWSLPLKTTRLERREGLIVALTVEHGQRELTVYGEAAPLPDFSRETLSQAEEQLLLVLLRLVGQSLPVQPFDSQDWLTADVLPSVAFAVESALWLVVLAENKPVNPADIKLPVAPLLTGTADNIIHCLQHWSEDWPTEFKLKVARGGDVKDDVDLARQVLTNIPDTVRLRLDANRRWSLSQACEFAQQLSLERITYIEEPVGQWRECAGFYQLTHMPFAWDETLQNPGFQFQTEKGLAALVIKPTLVGGLRRCGQLVTQAQAHGIRVVLSSSFESVLGVDILKLLSHHWSPGEAAGLDTLSAFSQHLYKQSVPVGSPLPEQVLQHMELIWHC